MIAIWRPHVCALQKLAVEVTVGTHSTCFHKSNLFTKVNEAGVSSSVTSRRSCEMPATTGTLPPTVWWTRRRWWGQGLYVYTGVMTP